MLSDEYIGENEILLEWFQTLPPPWGIFVQVEVQAAAAKPQVLNVAPSSLKTKLVITGHLIIATVTQAVTAMRNSTEKFLTKLCQAPY